MMSKLKSKRGATLIFALVALAVAVTVCAVVIYAAQSNAGRIRAAQRAEQNQLTLNSAAGLVREKLAGVSVKMETIERVEIRNTAAPVTTETRQQLTVTQSREGGESTLFSGGLSEDNADIGSLDALQLQVVRWIQLIQTGVTTKNACQKEYTISVDNDQMADVHLTLTMTPGATGDLEVDERDTAEAQKYYLTAVFALAESDPDAGENSASDTETITMTFMAMVKESSSNRLISNKTENDGEDSVNVKTLERKSTLTVNWDSANVVVNVAG